MRDSSRFRFACFWGILLAALLLRGSMLAVKWSELTEDRDGYLGIAAAIMAGDGFCTPGSSVPTAFRPPLYPLLLSLPDSWAGSLGIAVVQLFLGLACVAGTMIWARQWIPRGGVCLAGAIVACDPLLLRYTSQPMTEVASAALTAWLMWAWCRYARQRNWGNLCLTGGLFGLAVLCRPAVAHAGGTVHVVRDRCLVDCPGKNLPRGSGREAGRVLPGAAGLPDWAAG
ncbi:MAG: glycosyltransferase family 39 protein [Planctomycetaceae bacterium]